MNIHKNARLTLARRIELVRHNYRTRTEQGRAACTAGVSEPTVRKWLGRFLAEGEPVERPLSRPRTARARLNRRPR